MKILNSPFITAHSESSRPAESQCPTQRLTLDSATSTEATIAVTTVIGLATRDPSTRIRSPTKAAVVIAATNRIAAWQTSPLEGLGGNRAAIIAVLAVSRRLARPTYRNRPTYLTSIRRWLFKARRAQWADAAVVLVASSSDSRARLLGMAAWGGHSTAVVVWSTAAKGM
jgi:hypothetical protein